MDFKRLVDDGKYKKEDCSPIHQAFIDGMEYAREEILNELCDCEPEDDTSTLEKIALELKAEVIKNLGELLEHSIAEKIVIFTDNDHENDPVEDDENEIPFS